jgi:replicative DNA helicase
LSGLKFVHISHAIEETKLYLDARRKGLITSLRTGINKLDNATLDGFEWGKIITLAGASGSGKSLIVELFKRGFVESNPNEKFKILSFEFEMLSRDQIIRQLSGKVNKSTKYLQTAQIDDDEFAAMERVMDSMKDYPIYYVDNTGTVREIVETIKTFIEQFNMIENKEGLVVTLDHIILTMGGTGEDDKVVVDRLYKSLVKLKKAFSAIGFNIMFILLSQLNREHKKSDRILNPELHYPTEADLFGSSIPYMSSDYVLISHKPSRIPGMPEWYGPPLPNLGFPNGLPVRNPEDPSQPMIYWHLVKNRGDEEALLLMLDNFKNSKVDEYKRKRK